MVINSIRGGRGGGWRENRMRMEKLDVNTKRKYKIVIDFEVLFLQCMHSGKTKLCVCYGSLSGFSDQVLCCPFDDAYLLDSLRKLPFEAVLVSSPYAHLCCA